MRPHPRIRKTIKWGGAAACVLLVVSWALSELWVAFWCTSAWGFGFDKGGLYYYHGDPSWGAIILGHKVIRANHFRIERRWLPLFSVGRLGARGPARGWGVQSPYWLPLVPALLITAAAWRLDTLARRRARQNLCPKCSYDRTGLAAGAKCPECGSAAP